MAGKTTAFAGDWLKLIFNATPIANIADNATSSPATTLYASLHFATATTFFGTDDQTTDECSYTGYARVALARNSGAWTITGNSVAPNSDIVFPRCTSGSDSAVCLGIGLASSGAGRLIWAGNILPFSFGINPGISVVVKSGTTFITET
jgi:hypothetical protein